MAGELEGRRDVAVDQRRAAARRELRQVLGARRHHDVAADHAGPRAPAAMRVAWSCVGPRGDAHVARHRAVLLGEAGHVEHRAALALEVRRHAEQRADGDHAAAADAGDQHVPGLVAGRRRGRRQRAEAARRRRRRRRASTRRRRPPCTETKLGQCPCRQVQSLLQDDWLMRRLRPQLGLDRLDRDAVALHAAVAAALAHALVDHDALVGVGELAALAQAARLGRAGLVVDQRRDARAPRAARAARASISSRWWKRRRRRGKRAVAGYLSGASPTTAMRCTPSARSWRAISGTVISPASALALDRLAAGHRDRAVDEDLVGDV